MDNCNQESLDRQYLSREEEEGLWSLCGEGMKGPRKANPGLPSPCLLDSQKVRVAPQRYQDLIQEGMMALIKAVDRFEPSRNNRFVTYGFYRIKGQMTNFLQRVEAKAPLPVDDSETVTPDPFDVGSLDWRICLLEGIEALSSREGEVIKALVLEGRKAREYADSIGMDVSNVYRIQRQALARLRAWLELEDTTERP